MRLSCSRMPPSRYAAEILSAIADNDQAGLQRRLADAASSCQSTAALASFEAESFAALDACVETLQSRGDVSEARRYATLHILRHLAEAENKKTITPCRVRESLRFARTAVSHRSRLDPDNKRCC